jgi:hypothetical protein
MFVRRQNSLHVYKKVTTLPVSLAAKEFGIATHVISLAAEEIETIKEAQRKQNLRANKGGLRCLG